MQRINLRGNKLFFIDMGENFFIDLNKESISNYDLKNKDEITMEEYYELIELRARSMAYFLLAKRDYPSKELYLKLVEKYREKTIVKKIVEEFQELGYLDDFSYASSYINSHSYGRKKMEMMLYQKGISKEIIAEVLSTPENNQKEMEEIIKQLNKMKDKDEAKKIASLMRKGFEYDKIRKAIAKLKYE